MVIEGIELLMKNAKIFSMDLMYMNGGVRTVLSFSEGALVAYIT